MLFSSICSAIEAMRSMGGALRPGDIDQQAGHVKASEAIGAFSIAFDRLSQLIGIAYSSEYGADISHLSCLFQIAAQADVFLLELRQLELDLGKSTPEIGHHQAGIRVAQFLRSIAELCGGSKCGSDCRKGCGDIHALLTYAEDNLGSHREIWAIRMIEYTIAQRSKVPTITDPQKDSE